MEKDIFNDAMKDALSKIELELPEKKEAPEKYIEKNEIPENVLKDIGDAILSLEKKDLPMPFVHLTVGNVIDEEGQIKPTGFIDDIKQRGLKVNTNGLTFVKRDFDEYAELAEPEYFKGREDFFVEAVAEMLKNYTHHGVRTNKRILGFSYKGTKERDYKSSGIGIPAAFVFDRKGIPVKRGSDGIEHYVAQVPVIPKKMMGVIEVLKSNKSDLGIENKNEAIEMADKIANFISEYVKNNF